MMCNSKQHALCFAFLKWPLNADMEMGCAHHLQGLLSPAKLRFIGRLLGGQF